MRALAPERERAKADWIGWCLGKREAEVPVRQVIGAYQTLKTLELYYLTRDSAKSQLALRKVEGTADEAQTKAWCEEIMNIAYQGASQAVEPHIHIYYR